MFRKIKERLDEPSTFVALGGLFSSLGVLLKIDEAPAIAQSLVAASESLAGGDFVTGGSILIGGVLMAFGAVKPERK